MIAAWILYALVVGALTAGAAWVLEALFRSHRKATRWIWAASMGFASLWPLLTLLLPEASPEPSLLQGVPLVAMEPLTIQVGDRSLWHALETPLLVAWLGSSLVLSLLGLILLLRTRRIRRSWVDGRARGRPVLFSEDWGPAVIGFFDSRIVLPRWCQAMEEPGLDLILVHETEHLEAGDLRLIILAGIPPVLLPWSLPLWWMWYRLRLAVEGDCDLRVLRKNPRATRAYLELLLEVGRRLPETRAAAAMLSEPERTLERRIKIMTMPFPRKPVLRGAILVTVGLGLIAVACLAPTPTAVETDVDLPAVEAAAEPPDPALDPTFTPYTVRPDVKNRSEVARAMEENYPPLLRDAGIGGTTTVWFYIDEEGVVQRTRINQSSGHRALDEAALRVAGAIEFTPALNRDKAVPVWISLPITFSVKTGAPAARRVPVRAPSEGPESSPDLALDPTFTPYTVRPDIVNRDEVARAMEEEYPPLLRDAGIGGTATVWIFIDAGGVVGNTRINQSSGHPALDDAALRVAGAIDFTPALNGDEVVPVWISLPITFSVR